MITADMPSGWFDGDIRRSTPANPKGGSAIWYVNEWAMLPMHLATNDTEAS
jgi:hypothetical protein